MLSLSYFYCLLLLLTIVIILINDSYNTIYKIVNQDQQIQYLSCFNLNEIIINKTKINTNEIKNEFNFHLKMQKNKKDERNRLISNEIIEKIINQTKSRDYLIYQNRLCFVFSNHSDFRSFPSLFLNLPISQNFFVLNNETFSFLKLETISSSFSRLSIQHKEYPYSRCTKDYSNFKCLNDKIRRIQPLSRYYYRSDDNESIELNYQINQTIIDNELKIIKQCNQIDCNINLLYPADKKSDPITLKSFLSISKLDFYLQLIGLIVLFLDISIYQLIIKIINSIDLKPLKIRLLRIKLIKLKFEKFKKIFIKLSSKLRLNRFKLLTRKYLKINNLILLIVLIIIICLSILFSRSIYNFINERDDPFKKIISNDSIKLELSIVICISMRWIKRDDYNIYNRSLSELEKESDNGLNIVLKDIYLEFLNKKIPTKWQLESKLIKFRYYSYYLSRCFQLRISLNQPKYQTIFSVTRLTIEFDRPNQFIDIFILTDNEIFNSYSYKHHSGYNFRKKILERSKLNKIKKCEDYDQFDNCNSKSNCIDQCTTKGIYNQIKNLTKSDYLFIDKNYFTDNEWSNLFIKPFSKYDKELYTNISKECENKYSELDPCVDTKFEHHSRTNYKGWNKREIDLNYEVITYKEVEPSMLKLLLDLLNIQSIFFNLNVLKLLVLIFKFKFNSKLKIILKLLIYLICSFGLIKHFYLIYNEILIGEMDSHFYQLIDIIQSPDLTFCFDLNHTKLINQNYKLTYQYLDKITSDQLKEDLIFNQIGYLNQSNKWTKLNKENNFKDDNLKIEVSYYLDRKCFKIRQNIKYNRNQFEFNDKMVNNGLVLKILFNRTHLDETIFYFYSQTKSKFSENSYRFSKIQEFNLRDQYMLKSFKIRHELIKTYRKFILDFDLIDSERLIEKLINYYFEMKMDSVTLKLPLEKKFSNLNSEVDDNLFIQLYNDIKRKLYSSYLNQYADNNYVEIHDSRNPPEFDLEFSLSFFQKVIVSTSENSKADLQINLLTALSLWFNFCILDLHTYLYLGKIRLAFFYLSELLLKFESILYKKVFN